MSISRHDQGGVSLGDLMHRDEKKMVTARKEFYEKSNSNQKLVRAGEITGDGIITFYIFD